MVTFPAGRALSASRASSAARFCSILRRLLAKEPRNFLQDVDESRTSEAGLFRKISTAPHRFGPWRQKHGQRPAALLSQEMQRIHVDLIDVGPFFAVNLDVDEQLVHHPGSRFILEQLMRHHVAPMARRVTNREKDWPIRSLCFG